MWKLEPNLDQKPRCCPLLTRDTQCAGALPSCCMYVRVGINLCMHDYKNRQDVPNQATGPQLARMRRDQAEGLDAPPW